MTLPLEDKEKILAHLRAICVYLKVNDHEPMIALDKLRLCLEEERLYDDHICITCKMPWALHPKNSAGEPFCISLQAVIR